MRELIIAGMKGDKPFGAKVNMTKKQKAGDLVDKITNLVKAVNRANLDSYSIFVKED